MKRTVALTVIVLMVSLASSCGGSGSEDAGQGISTRCVWNDADWGSCEWAR